ncbi:hypothetical protein AXF42_Ash005247 [Apostasia shenzhenica]|uniref:Uncharacterized protein n=1 Tax=Apostasia shenzhenica TaxID=1088818 RepID=A0A2I0B6D8_9ASPA|nr:hypothetical protein AXF42_Ash005247 [Apostasia shenzhenica]
MAFSCHHLLLLLLLLLQFLVVFHCATTAVSATPWSAIDAAGEHAAIARDVAVLWVNSRLQQRGLSFSDAVVLSASFRREDPFFYYFVMLWVNLRQKNPDGHDTIVGKFAFFVVSMPILGSGHGFGYTSDWVRFLRETNAPRVGHGHA